jgi:uncharacterized OB-fold protein
MSDKNRVPAVEGMLDLQSPCLLGSACKSCGTVYFPREETLCRNPNCASTDFDEKRLSTRGRLWSFTNSCYAPPAPFIAGDPYEPITVAAVELEDEKMVVLGQVDGAEVADLETGMEMELVLGRLYEDDENEYVVWKWRRV